MTTFSPPEELAPLFALIDALAREDDVRVFAVGGTVRDVLLQRTPRDIDVAIDGDALTFAERLAEAIDGDFVAMDDANAIARVVLRGGATAHVDVTALRGDLNDDLRRRDFTIDALAAPLAGGPVVDLCGGVDDVRVGVVRMVSATNLDADPLRLLRAVRLAGDLDFRIDAGTAEAIAARAGRVTEPAPERRRDELARIFALERAEPALRQLDSMSLLDPLFPNMAEGRGVSQPPNHHAYDVFDHAMHAVEALDLMLAAVRPAPIRPNDARVWIWDEIWSAFAWCKSDLRAYLLGELSEGRSRGAILKLATFIHDVGKPRTRTIEPDGRIRFFGHADAGARMAGEWMRSYRFSAAEARFVTALVAEHLRPVQLAAVGQAPTRRAIYRFHRDLGEAAPAVLLLALADAAGSRGPGMTREGWSRHARYMNSLLVRLRETEGIVRSPRLLTGHDIMSEFGIGEGPLVGRLLEELREAQAVGDVEAREDAMAFVRTRIEREEGHKAGAE